MRKTVEIAAGDLAAIVTPLGGALARFEPNPCHTELMRQRRRNDSFQ
jgi:hypothetical protein